jgi:hypothetical protein
MGNAPESWGERSEPLWDTHNAPVLLPRTPRTILPPEFPQNSPGLDSSPDSLLELAASTAVSLTIGTEINHLWLCCFRI